MALFSRRSKTPSAAQPSTGEADVPVETEPGADAGAPAGVDPGASAADGTTASTEPAMPAADGTTASAAPATPAADGTTTSAAPATPPGSEAPDEPVPHVNISLSTYGKAPTPAPAAAPLQAPAEAPAPTEKVPGLPDNVVLRSALAALPEKPENRDIINAMRQTMQGNLYVRVRGDARALLAEGKQLNLAVSAIEDQRFLLAFTGGEALQRSIASDGDTQTSAVGQPAQVILRTVVDGPYAGLIIDHATPQARIILPRQLIEKALEQADDGFPVKNLLAAPRTDATANDLAQALTRAKLWVAAGKAEDSDRVGLAEVRTQDGERLLQVFSHPLEVVVQGRDERPLPLTAEQLGKALAADSEITGILIDPAGPWIRLNRDDLAPVLALAQ
ncbi:SseB family protein [Microbacterium sp. MC2]